MKTVDTEKKAKELAAEWEKIIPKLFCPLAKTMCRTDCQCWRKPHIQPSYDRTKFNVYEGYCDNGMFWNE